MVNTSGAKLANAETLYELGARPVDRMAWRVVQPGEHWETSEAVEILTFDVPPEPPESVIKYADHNVQRPTDYSGVRVGRLTAWYYWRHKATYRVKTVRVSDRQLDRNKNRGFGYMGDDSALDKKHLERGNGAKDHEWLCRCDCGLFFVRTAYFIKKAIRAKDKDNYARYLLHCMCSHCYELEKLRGNVPDDFRQ